MSDAADEFLADAAKALPTKLDARTMRELEDLYVILDSARTAFNEALKATAEKTAIKAKSIRKAVAATVKANIPEVAEEMREVAELLNIDQESGE